MQFTFCFELITFASQISNLLLPLDAEGAGGCEFDIPTETYNHV